MGLFDSWRNKAAERRNNAECDRTSRIAYQRELDKGNAKVAAIKEERGVFCSKDGGEHHIVAQFIMGGYSEYCSKCGK